MPLAIAASLEAMVPCSVRAESPRCRGARQRVLNEARSLRDGGRVTEACSRFAQSKDLAPGVGVSLDLADCFERLGRTTSAWHEYVNAEKLAREHNDSRADVARIHVQALQARLSQMTIAVSAETAAHMAEIRLDGQTVPREAYNIALAVDPGHHQLSVLPKAGPPRTLDVHIEPNAPLVTVHAENARPSVDDKAMTPATPPGPADILFEDAKRLRESGKTQEACAKFAQSQALAPGVGIALHLGDCYERLGRTASAWTEFSLAEKAAHERSDAREATAHARALALEPNLQRVTIIVPASVPKEEALIQLDGRTVAPSLWNVAVAIDSGDHLVTFQAPGIERRTFPLHLDATEASVTVRVGEPAAQAEPSPTNNSLAPGGTPPGSGGDRSSSTYRWVEIGLLGGAVVAAGVGAGLLVVKNNSMSNTGADGRPYVDPVAAAASKVAFGVAGVAAASAIVLYLVAPRPKDTGLSVSPAPLVGGGGAILSGSF